MPDQLNENIETLLKESRSLRDVCERLVKRIRRGEFVQLLCIIAIFGSGFAIGRVQLVVNDINSNRATQIVASCKQFNDQRTELRAAFKETLLALVPEGQSLTSEQTGQLANYDVTVDKKLPFRDCSPEGIDVYFNHPPLDPATVPTTTTK